MLITVDLTREKFDDFDTVDFYDIATIFFDATTFLPNTVSFKVWGAHLMPDFKWDLYMNPVDPKLQQAIGTGKNAVAIQGFGTFTLLDIVAGSINISPYSRGKLLKDEKGKEITFKREWALDQIDSECYGYRFDSTIYFPYGAGDLRLYAKGSGAFTFNTQDCVNGIDFITNPDRQNTFWGYLNDRSISTNSYTYQELDPNSRLES